MSLTNSQYDEILRGYDARQLKNRRVLEKRIADAYARIPALKEIDDAIASCSVAQARKSSPVRTVGIPGLSTGNAATVLNRPPLT